MTDIPHAARLLGQGWLRNGGRPGNPGNRAPLRRSHSQGHCRSPAMPNGRCRMHGGMSTGAKTAERIERIRAARAKHGRYSQATIAKRREARAVIRTVRTLLRSGATRVDEMERPLERSGKPKQVLLAEMWRVVLVAREGKAFGMVGASQTVLGRSTLSWAWCCNRRRGARAG
jgi:hypothetical protein